MLKVPLLAAVLEVGMAVPAAIAPTASVDVLSQGGCGAVTQPWLPRTLRNGDWVRSAGHAESDHRFERAPSRIDCTLV